MFKADTDDCTPQQRGPLVGVKVVEFAQVIAGPLAGTMLADLGADVVHVESPGAGDTARGMGPAKDGHYLWWKVLGRNKRSVTLNLHEPDGREVARQMVAWADVVIVSFRSSTLERFCLDWKSVSEINPSVILLQVSGYGSTSSRRDEPGFGKVGEARSGVVHITGLEDGPPIHTGFSHGDATTGLMGAFAIAAALARRNADPQRRGEWIDLALFETLYRLVEWQVIVHDQLGTVPQKAGNSLAVAPAAVINTYKSADGDWITVTSATQRSVLNIVRLLGLDVDKFTAAEAQRTGAREIDLALASWISQRGTDEALEALIEAEVVASKIFDVADIFADKTYKERGGIVTVTDSDLGDVRMQGVVPQFRNDPGAVWRTGPALGEDNDLVYVEWLGIDETKLSLLKADGVI